jgi:aldose 1-epimerase
MMSNSFKLAVILGAGVGAAFLAGCACCPCVTKTAPGVGQADFGTTADGQKAFIYTLKNKHGVEARISNYGGILVSLKVPDRNGQLEDVVLGYDKLEDYLKASPYFGAMIGRYGNRIAKGKFSLNGQDYTLAVNNDANALHGGIKGFDKVIWGAKPGGTAAAPTLELSYVSRDGEEGYPGNLTVKAIYTLTADNAIRLDYTATTDKDTVINLTQHSYFNLAGTGDILGHQVQIYANRFTPVDKTLIPTGELRPVAGTPFDFTQPHTIGERIGVADEQLKFGGGYDHNWVLNKPQGVLDTIARVYEPTTGRVLEVLSTEPGLQFYCGNFLDGSNIGKGGKAYQFRTGFCMEPQHFPDSPNHPEFPSVVLKPGQTYKNTIVFKFSAK